MLQSSEHTVSAAQSFLKAHGWALSGQKKNSAKSNQALPFITIGVLSYNRHDSLWLTLQALQEINYPGFEIIVVDNASHDGSVTMVNTEFPEVQLIPLERNIGTAGRNEFLKRARGKYIFCYDDDTVPATPDTILNIVQFMEENTRVAALSGNYYQPLTGIEETAGWEVFAQRKSSKDFEGLFIVEGGVCFRRSALKETGYYEDRNMWGAEGVDLSFDFFKKGYLMHVSRNFTTLHFKHQGGRRAGSETNWRTQNLLFLLAKHFPLWAFIPLSFGYIVRRLVGIALHPGTAVGVAKGIFKGISGAGAFFKRKPKLTVKQIWFLKRSYLMFYRW